MEVQAGTSLGPDSPPTDSDPDLSREQTEPSAWADSNATSTGQTHTLHVPRLKKVMDNDDVKYFLTAFERIAVACPQPKSDWVFHLIPLLVGKARSAYVYMDTDDSLEYDKRIKSAILSKYDFNPKTYRHRFHSLDVNPDKSTRELYVRLKELYRKWIQPKDKNINKIGEIIILKQYLGKVSSELQVWI